MDGLISTASNYDVDNTINRFISAIAGRGFTIWARIDYSANVKEAQTPRRANVLLLFGHPVAIAKVIGERPEIGVDLPMKALFWEDQRGKSHLTINDPRWVLGRWGLSGSSVDALSNLLVSLVKEATGTVTQTVN